MALVDVVLGYDCNLACDYCTITPEMRTKSLSTRAVVQALAEGRSAGYDAVAFTGGEPTIRPDLVALVAVARRAGYSDIKVQSNGLLLAHAPNLSRLIAAGATRIHISVHTHDESAYDPLVQRVDMFRWMCAGLDAVARTSVRLVADVILKSDTFRKLPDAVRWLHARGVRNVHLWFVSLTDGNRDRVDSMPRMTDVVPFMHDAFEFGRANGMEIQSLHVPRCLLGPDADRAYDPGADRVWVVTPDSNFELKDSRLAGRMHVPACEVCTHRSICPGVRPDYIEQYGDEEIARARGLPPSTPGRRALPIVHP